MLRKLAVPLLLVLLLGATGPGQAAHAPSSGRSRPSHKGKSGTVRSTPPRPASTAGDRPSVGLNKFDLFRQYLGRTSRGGGAGLSRVTRAMALKAIRDAHDVGVGYMRVSATGLQPLNYGQPGDLDLWRSDPKAYWRLFDRMMADLKANQVKIVPVFVWNLSQFPAMTGETTSQLVRNPDSKAYRLLLSYIGQFVSRYKDHPSLYFYELTNEMNLNADLDEHGRCVKDRPDSTEGCRVIGNFTTDQMVAFTERLAGFIRARDSRHRISSGFSLPRKYAEHLRRRPEFGAGGGDFTPDSKSEFVRNLRDIHRGVDIVSIHFYNQNRENERFGNTGVTNAGLLTVVKQAADHVKKRVFVGEFGDSAPSVKQDRRGPFTQAVLRKIVELKIPYSAVWGWEFYQTAPYLTYDNPGTEKNIEPGYTDQVISAIQGANARFGHRPPSLSKGAKKTPHVVLTWPTQGSRLSGDQLVHAVASGKGGKVKKVDFLVDGKPRATVTSPPYQFHLKTESLPPGSHTITARAYDSAGTTGQDSVTITVR